MKDYAMSSTIVTFVFKKPKKNTACNANTIYIPFTNNVTELVNTTSVSVGTVQFVFGKQQQ